MFRLFFISIFAFAFNAGAQTSAPKSINYQGVARNAGGTPITTPFDIQFVIKDATTIVHDETQVGIQPNSLGLFSTIIGKAPNTLTLTTWNTGPFTLDVLIKSGPTFTLLGTQALVSVPFALFAGNVPTSYTNNILTIGANSYSIATGSASILNGDVTGTPSNNTVIALQNFPISTNTPTNNQVLSYISGAWTPTTLAASSIAAWVKTGNNVYLSVLTDKVGIGTNSPISILDVTGNASTSTSILQINNSNTSNTSPAISVASNGGYAISANETSSTGGIAGQFNSNNGSAISATNNANTNPTIKGQNTSTSSNPLAHGVYGKTSNTHTLSSGVFGENVGGGPGVIGVNYTPIAAVMGINQFSTSSNGLAHGVYGLSNNSNGSASGVFGENKGGGIGVYGTNTNSSANGAIGVYGLVSNVTSATTAGVRGDANGVGPALQGIGFGGGAAVYGVKPNTSGAGNAGKFEINSSSNSADALFASTIGTGAAIHGITGTSVATSLGLWIENGHIKVNGSASFNTSAGSPTVAGGFNAPSVNVIGNDVKGIISFTTGATGFSPTNFCDIKVNFGKPYSVAPIIVVTPLVDLQGLSYMITNTQTNSFTLRLYRPMNMTVPITTSNAANTFNYIVIE